MGFVFIRQEIHPIQFPQELTLLVLEFFFSNKQKKYLRITNSFLLILYKGKNYLSIRKLMFALNHQIFGRNFTKIQYQLHLPKLLKTFPEQELEMKSTTQAQNFQVFLLFLLIVPNRLFFQLILLSEYHRISIFHKQNRFSLCPLVLLVYKHYLLMGLQQ